MTQRHRRVVIARMIGYEDVAPIWIDQFQTFDLHSHTASRKQGSRPGTCDPNLDHASLIEKGNDEADRAKEYGCQHNSGIGEENSTQFSQSAILRAGRELHRRERV